MKILALADFDPAGVVLSHRDALRACCPDIDFRVALHTAYTPRQRGADWVGASLQGCDAQGREFYAPGGGDLPALLEFAYSADVIQIHPGIGQPWADQPEHFLPERDPPVAPYFGRKDWPEIIGGSRARHLVAFFHGSVHARANIEGYRQRYAGLHFAASTLDYAVDLDAAYLPPALPLPAVAAPLRADDDPLIVAHTPTNPSIASTEIFLAAARAAGVVVNYASRRSHEEALAAKQRSHMTFDHLRGTFSVNSLEAASLGSIPLVALAESGRVRGHVEGLWGNAPPWPQLQPGLEGERALPKLLRTLADDYGFPGATRTGQELVRAWFTEHFTPAPIAARLERFYRGLR